MDDRGEYPTAQQEIDDLELGLRPSLALRHSTRNSVLWDIRLAQLHAWSMVSFGLR